MGHLKAPQRTRFPQPWPHIFTPGEPQLYSDLSLPTFCAGYIAIMQPHKDKPALNESYISHFQDLMVLACSYKWPAVRAYHYKVLRSIELGLVKWGDSFEPLKQPFFIPSVLFFFFFFFFHVNKLFYSSQQQYTTYNTALTKLTM